MEANQIHPAEFEQIPEESLPTRGLRLEQIDTVGVHLSVELGRTELTIRDVLALRPGAVFSVDRLAGDPSDVLLNGRVIAKAEVVVTADEHFGIRVTEIVAGARPAHTT